MRHLSRNAHKAVVRYGLDTCLNLERLHREEGWGASGLAFEFDLTTRQADAAINAGRELRAIYEQGESP